MPFSGCECATRNGFTALYASKNGSMFTTRSFSSGRPLIASTKIGFVRSRSFIRVLHARRLRPLIRIASEPQMPCAHERRNVSEPSCSHLILWSASRIRSVEYTSTSKSCQCGSASTSGSKRRMLSVTWYVWTTPIEEADTECPASVRSGVVSTASITDDSAISTSSRAAGTRGCRRHPSRRRPASPRA